MFFIKFHFKYFRHTVALITLKKILNNTDLLRQTSLNFNPPSTFFFQLFFLLFRTTSCV